MSKNRNGLFLFHRDLRIYDNIGLHKASNDCDQLYTVFIFTPEQVSKSNHFKSVNAVKFMIESLQSLANEIQSHNGNLILMYGSTVSMIKLLLKNLDIHCLYFNRDYTPYAIRRDTELYNLCKNLGIQCKMFDDYYLREPGSILNQQNGVYHKFTPFYDKVISNEEFSKIQKVVLGIPKNFSKNPIIKFPQLISLSDANEQFITKKYHSPNVEIKGGRKEGIHQLRLSLKTQEHYNETRDFLAIEPSHLSAYLKFGCISIREVFWAFYKKYGKHHELLRQLIWRDFFAHILFRYPDTLEKMYSSKFENIQWNKNTKWLDAWKSGKTGFPMVDAAMRQLNSTGYMHNRGRMLVAYFLIKTLLLDWREGEKYFAQLLVDYDVASNSGNWQSIVGGGVYSSAWFRTMSPWIQSVKFDPDSVYVKRWIPELSDVPKKDIHQWNKVCNDSKYKNIDYPKPICDFSEQSDKWREKGNPGYLLPP